MTTRKQGGKGRPFVAGLADGKGGSKPGEHRGGRQIGTPNVVTRALKDQILKSIDNRGGQAYLDSLPDELFVPLIGRILPREIKAEVTDLIAVRLDGRGVAPTG